MSEADSILTGINNSRQNAQSTAVGAIDADPDQAGRAIELEKATGVSSAAIYGDVEGFEAQHKAALAGEIVKNNPHIADYINSHPLAAAVSNGDLGQLDTISQSISNLTGEERANLFRGRIHDILPTAQQTPEPNRPSPAELMKQWEGKPALNSVTGSRDIGDYLNHYINNVVSTLGEETEESAKQVVDPDRPVSERAIAASVAVPKAIAYTGLAMMQPINDAFQAIGDTIERLSGGHIWSQDVQTALMMPGILGLGERVGDLKFGKALKDHVEAINLAAPHILEGKLPPVGLNDLLDGAHKELAKQDIKNFGDLEKEVQKSQTKEIAPELFEKNFIGPRTDATIGVDAVAVKKLYGDKVPEPDDNILGFIPNLVEQIAGAEQFGGRIEIPLASWLAKVDPEVAKVLKDDIAVRRGGMTINETKPPEVSEGTEKPQPKPAPIDSIDAIRRPAGLDPVAAAGQVRLVRVPDEEAETGGHTFDFQDAEGKRIGGGTIDESVDGKTLRVGSMAAGTQAGLPGFLGQRQVIGLIRQLAAEFPHAEQVTGLRVSGARDQHAEISLPLRPSEKQLTDFMRSGFEKQSVMDAEGKLRDVQPIYSTTVGDSIPPEAVAKATDSPVMKAFGEKIHELTKDVPIHVISRADMDRIYGPTGNGFHQLFTNGESNIFLPDDIGFMPPEQVLHLVMHEASHAATVAALESDVQLKTKVRLLMNEVNGHLTTNDYAARLEHNYAFTNEKEFVAEGQSKESFQERLKSVPIPRELWKDLGSEPKNAWEALKNIVKELWERITGKEVPKNALNALFKLSDEIEGVQKEVQGRGKIGTDFGPSGKTRYEKEIEEFLKKNNLPELSNEQRIANIKTRIGQIERDRRDSQKIEDENYPAHPDLAGLRQRLRELQRPVTDFAPPKETQLELPGLTRVEDREAFEKAAAIGMTVKQFRQYQELIKKRDVQDMDHFRAQAERRERQRQTAEWKAEENRAREEAKTNLQGRPDIAADNLLRDGTYLGEKLKGRVRLDSDKLTAEQKAGLPEDYLKPGGINPDDAATMFGYHNPDAMLGAIKQLHADRGDLGPKEHVNKLAEKITQDHMTREFGNLEQNILEEAKDHVISPTQLDILHEELVALGSKFGGELSIKKADIKAWVKKQFSEMPISMHRIDDYLAAAGRAGRGAEQALLDEDPREAFKFKQQQYVSMQMANEAKAYEKARASADRLFKRLAKREITNIPQNDVAHIRDQMLRAGLPIGRSVQGLAEDIKRAGDFDKFLAVKEDQDSPLLIPDWMYGNWNKKLDTMSAGEFSEFSKAIRQLYNLGADENKITIAGNKLDFDETRGKLIDQLAKQAEMTEVKIIPRNRSAVGKFSGDVNTIFHGYLIQAESIFNRWDLGNPHGMFNNLMYDAAEASNHWSGRIKYYTKKMDSLRKELLKGVDLKARLPDILHRPSTDTPYDLITENGIRMIMDMGNPSNKGKFTEGWKVDPALLEQWFKANTTKEMWAYAQKLGDIHEEMFGELKDMIDRESGVIPDRVQLEPFTDPHGIQRAGWYSPMMYDQVELGTSRKLMGLPSIDPNKMVGMMDTGYFKATTRTGAEINRTTYAAPTDLSLDRLGYQMSKILYDAAFRPYVIKFGKLLRDQQFLNAITKYSGLANRELIKDWFKDIVGTGKGVSSSADIAAGSIGEFLRRNMVAQWIGWNIHTAEKHGLSAAMTSLVEVGPRRFAEELFGLTRMSPDQIRSNWEFSNDSEEIQRRSQHFIESFGGQIEGLRTGDKTTMATWRNWMLEKGSSIVAFADLLSTKASWNAKFKDGMAALAVKYPDKLPEEYKGEAMRIADSIVRRAHGSTALTSRPGLMRSGSPIVRQFATLYSFWNQMLQRIYEASWQTTYAKNNWKQGDYEKGRQAITRAGLLIASSVLWPALVHRMINGPPAKQGESTTEVVAKTLIEGVSPTIPMAGEFVDGWLNGWEGGNTGVFDAGWRELGSAFSDARKGAKAFDAEHGGKTLKDWNALVGMLTGVTNDEVGNTMKTLWDATHRSKDTPRNASELYRDLTSGKPAGTTDLFQKGIELVGQKGRRK